MKPLDVAHWAAIGIACCIGVAVAIASYIVATSTGDSRAWYVVFLLSTGILVLPQAAVVLLALLAGKGFAPRLAAIGGIATALGLDLAATVGLEVRVYGGEGFLYPFVYMFSLPGVLVGALAIIAWLRSMRRQIPPFGAFAISAAAVLASSVISSVISYAVVCNAAFHYCPMPWEIHQRK
ncbi:MAG: hypothetical protein ACLPPF_18815 [Rhodomicrobium sp.]